MRSASTGVLMVPTVGDEDSGDVGGHQRGRCGWQRSRMRPATTDELDKGRDGGPRVGRG